MKNINILTLFKKLLYYPITRIVLSILAIVSITGLAKELVTRPLFTAIFSSDILIKILISSISTFIMVSIYFLLVKYYEKRPFTEFSLEKSIREISFGFMIGFTVISLIIYILNLFGYYSIVNINDLLSFLPTITVIMGSVMLEELIFRGVILKILESWKGTTIAVIFSSIVFQIPHFMNPHEGLLPAILGILFGLATGLMYTSTKGLWLPFAFHFGWNLAQPLFGTTLSGINEFEILFEAKIQGPKLLTGSAFGIEDSILSMSALIILILIYFIKTKRKGNWIMHSKQRIVLNKK